MPAVIVAGEFQLIILYRGMTMQLLSEMKPCIQIMGRFMKERDWGTPHPDAFPFDEYDCSPLILPGEWNPPFIVAPLDWSMTDADFRMLKLCQDKGSIIFPIALIHIGNVQAQCEKYGLDPLMPHPGCVLGERAMKSYFSHYIPKRAS